MTLESDLMMGYQIYLDAAFINHPEDKRVLKQGVRASLWRDKERGRVGEAETATEALSNLENYVRPEPLNDFHDEEVEFTVKLQDPDWTLWVYTPNMGDARATSNFGISRGAITSDFTIKKTRSGDCRSLVFDTHNGELGLQTAEIVKMTYKDESIFYGPVWLYRSKFPKSSPMYIAGPRANMSKWMALESHAIPRGKYTVPEFLKILSQLAFNGVVTYDPSRINVPDFIVEVDDLQLMTVERMLDQLVLKIPNARWGVDADGFLYMNCLSSY